MKKTQSKGHLCSLKKDKLGARFLAKGMPEFLEKGKAKFLEKGNTLYSLWQFSLKKEMLLFLQPAP